jgi:predicted phage terminase large subunit-like protein
MIYSDKAIAEANLYEFLKQAWHIIEGSHTFIDEWHLKVIAEHLELVYRRKIKNLLVNVIPRSGKTNLISVAFPAWVWIHNPEEKFLCASCSNPLSLEIADKSKMLIESPWFQKNWGHQFKIRKNQNAKGFFANDKTGYRISTSVGSHVVGRGGTIQICVTTDTMIQCETGVFTIGNIVNNKLDVNVLSYNHDLNVTEYKPIKTYYKHEGKQILEIEFDDGSILECTAEHPVYVEGRGYIDAGELQQGDILQRRVVKRIKRKEQVPEFVYNLEIQDNNNYFANNILVHNCDDPNAAGGESELAMDVVNNWWSLRWFNRLNDIKNDRRIVVQQRTSEKDISGLIIANDVNNEWIKVILPLEYESSRKTVTVPLFNSTKPWEDPRTKDGELLTSRLNDKEVLKLKRTLGSYQYAGQYQQRPAPLEGGMLKKSWFKLYQYDQLPDLDFIIQSWDTALTAKDESNYSACTTWGVFLDRYDNENVILLSSWRDKLEYPELREKVKRLASNYMDVGARELPATNRFIPDLIVVEAKASGDPLIQDLKRAGVYARPFIPNKYGDKIQRVRLVSALIESGVVWVPCQKNNITKIADFADEFLTNISYFPNVSSRDYVDTMTQALIILRDGNKISHPRDYYELEEPTEPKRFY